MSGVPSAGLTWSGAVSERGVGGSGGGGDEVRGVRGEGEADFRDPVVVSEPRGACSSAFGCVWVGLAPDGAVAPPADVVLEATLAQ